MTSINNAHFLLRINKVFLFFLPVLLHNVVDGIHHVEEELQAVLVVAGNIQDGGALYHTVFQAAFHFEIAQVFGKVFGDLFIYIGAYLGGYLIYQPFAVDVQRVIIIEY